MQCWWWRFKERHSETSSDNSYLVKKKTKEFLVPKLTTDAGKPGKIVQDELPSVSGNAELFDKVILSVLGPQAESSETCTSIDTAEVADAVANLIMDEFV